MNKLGKLLRGICKLLHRIKVWCQCKIGHDYTCAVEEGLDPTTTQLNDLPKGFFDYAKMYCKRCGYVYQPNPK